MKHEFRLPVIVLVVLILASTACTTMKSVDGPASAAAKAGGKAPAAKAAAGADSDAAIAAELQKRIKAAGLTDVAVKTTPRGVTITTGGLSFPADSAQITPQTAKRLDALARVFAGYENRKMLIEGHTAAVGKKEAQKELSVKRAQAVANYLVKKGAAKAALLVVEGKGGTVPLATNATDAGRAKNRRVEITLLH